MTPRLPVAVTKMSAVPDDVFEGRHLVAVHRRLQRADRVDLGDDDARALAAKGLSTTLADVAVTADHRNLAADEHVGRPVDAVDQRVPAAVLVVELRLGHRVVHVDGREQQRACLMHLVEPVDAGRGLLGHALQTRGNRRPASWVFGQRPLQDPQDDLVLLGVGRRRVRDRAGLLELDALVHEQCRVAAVVQNHVRTVALGPRQHLLGAPPVLLEGLALPRKHRHARRRIDGAGRPNRDRGGGVVLGGEDVAARPAHLCTKSDKRLNQDGGLHCHVQRAGDSRAGQRLGLAVLSTHRHEARHLVLREGDLLASEGGQPEVGNLEVERHACVSSFVGSQRARQRTRPVNL